MNYNVRLHANHLQLCHLGAWCLLLWIAVDNTSR